MRRKSSQRITAQEGSRILEKFIKQLSNPEDDLEVAHPVGSTPSLHGLNRQSSSHQHSHLSQRCSLPVAADVILESFNEESYTAATGQPTGNASDADINATSVSPTLDTAATTNPRLHRLQRQDAKSRKTFKIKRHHSTIKGSILRSATVKGNLRYTTPGQQGMPYSGTTSLPNSEICASLLERIETRIAEGRPVVTANRDAVGDIDTVTSSRDDSPMCRRPACDHVDVTTPDGDTIPSLPSSAVDASGHHYTPKWQSHVDDTLVASSPVGTARGRIARHGARMKQRSRSRSHSPVSPCDVLPPTLPFALRWSPPTCTEYMAGTDQSPKGDRSARSCATSIDQSWMAEHITEPAYQSASSDSVDTATESDTLLKGDDASRYNSRLLSYFDTDNLDSLDSLQDTRV